MSLKGGVVAAGRALKAGSVLPLSTTGRFYEGTDKWVHGYIPYYQRHLGPRRWRRNRILEIGVGGYEQEAPGGSLRMWRDYCPFSSIVGMDIHAKSVRLGRRVAFSQGDQSSSEDLDRAMKVLGGPPNIVIDDGSHFDTHAAASFLHLFPLLPLGALYVIEDLHTSYWEAYGGSIPASDSTAVGFSRRLVDEVQQLDEVYDRHPDWGPRPPAGIDDVAAVHVYPGIAFVEKVMNRACP